LITDRRIPINRPKQGPDLPADAGLMLHAQPGLSGERHEQLRQPFRQPLDAIDDGVLAVEGVSHVLTAHSSV